MINLAATVITLMVRIARGWKYTIKYIFKERESSHINNTKDYSYV